jgi:hypothetical protein
VRQEPRPDLGSKGKLRVLGVQVPLKRASQGTEHEHALIVAHVLDVAADFLHSGNECPVGSEKVVLTDTSAEGFTVSHGTPP